MANTFRIVIVIGVSTGIAIAFTLGLIYYFAFNLQNVFMDRCKTNLKKFEIASQKDCEKIWDSFTQAFVEKDPSDVSPKDYDFLMQTVSQVSKNQPCRKRMFWSGTKETAHDYAEKCSYLTQEDTLPAFLLDDIYWFGKKVKWCGKPENQEISTIGCHDRPYKAFWNRSSEAFAASACGDAIVMLDGSIDRSYDPDSTFGSVEVKRLKINYSMKSLHVMLVTKEGDAQKECSKDASLESLQTDLYWPPTFRYLFTIYDKCKVYSPSELKYCRLDLW